MRPAVASRPIRSWRVAARTSAFCAQVGERQRFLRLGEHRGDALIERGSRGGDGLGALDHLQGEGQALLRQLDDERPRRGSGAVLDGQ